MIPAADELDALVSADCSQSARASPKLSLEHLRKVSSPSLVNLRCAIKLVA